ncbi:hypothetical protein QBC43DRAFT_371104 [Cladorrhinum sp. PSN259]|nr:hypothetical protein QBC43DRAFT_371104 [Cladorrhinum sp. PSN259]
MWGDGLPWLIGYVILTFLWVIPLLVLWSISFCFTRRRKDPARVGFVWMKIVYPFWILSSLVYTAQGALAIWYDQDVPLNVKNGTGIVVNLEQWQTHLGDIALLFARVADISLLITFLELASGFTRVLCLHEGKPQPSHKRLRYIALPLTFVLFVLSVIVFAWRTSEFSFYYDLKRYDKPEDGSPFLDTPEFPANRQDWWVVRRTISGLDMSVRYLVWIASTPTLVYVSYVTHKTRINPPVRKFISSLLACTILDWIRLGVNAFFHPDLNLVYVYFDIALLIGAFVNYLLMFIILIIILCIGFRKSKGLWSTPQKWNTLPKNIDSATAGPEISPYIPALQQRQQQQQQEQHLQQQQQQQPVMAWQGQQPTRPPSYAPGHQQQQPNFNQQQPPHHPLPHSVIPQQPPLYYPQPQYPQQEQPQDSQPQHPLLHQLQIPKPVYQLNVVTQPSSSSLPPPQPPSLSPSSSTQTQTYQTPSQLQPTRLEIDEQKVLLMPFGPSSSSSPAAAAAAKQKMMMQKALLMRPSSSPAEENVVADGFQMQQEQQQQQQEQQQKVLLPYEPASSPADNVADGFQMQQQQQQQER